MTSAESCPKSIQYPSRTLERAERAIRCSPFTLKLLSLMRYESVELSAIARSRGVEQGYTRSPQSELAVENYLMWLIQVGALRREVDGQGITDSFRLTPLSRQLVEKAERQHQEFANPTLRDRCLNFFHRRLRLPL
ncbi:MAG: Npun_F0494 family protein [Cyanobacteria bacterium J06592_8]